MAPANDNFANRTLITGIPFTVDGDNTDATLESGEPSWGQHSVWYEWVAPAGGVYSFDTEGSIGMSDTKIGVYTGTAVDALTIVSQDDDSGTGYLSRISFEATASTSYKIAVTGYGSSDYGSFKLNGAEYTAPLWKWNHKSLFGVAPISGTKNIARESGGRLWMTLFETVNWDIIYLYYSDDSGATWSYHSAVPLHSGTYMYNPCLLIGVDDTLHFAHTEYLSGVFRVIYNTKPLDGLWGTPEVAVTAASVSQNLMAIESDGTIHLIWLGVHTSGNTVVNHAIRSGGSWGASAIISSGTQCSRITSAEADSSDNIHTNFMERNPTLYAIKYAAYSGSWSTETLASSTNNLFTSGITVDTSNNIHIVYDNSVGNEYIYLKKSGGLWSSPETVTDDDWYWSYAAPFVSGDGKIYVFFTDYTGDLDQISIVVKDPLSGWGSPEIISNTIDEDQDMGFTYCSYSPTPGQHTPTVGAFFVAVDYSGSSYTEFIYSTDLSFGGTAGTVEADSLGMELYLNVPDIDYWLARADAINVSFGLYQSGINTNIYEAPYFSTGLDLYRPAILDPTLEMNIAPIGLSAEKGNSTVVMNKSGSKSISISTTNNRNAIKLDTLLKKPIIFYYRQRRRISPPNHGPNFLRDPDILLAYLCDDSDGVVRDATSHHNDSNLHPGAGSFVQGGAGKFAQSLQNSQSNYGYPLPYAETSSVVAPSSPVITVCFWWKSDTTNTPSTDMWAHEQMLQSVDVQYAQIDIGSEDGNPFLLIQWNILASAPNTHFRYIYDVPHGLGGFDFTTWTHVAMVIDKSASVGSTVRVVTYVNTTEVTGYQDIGNYNGEQSFPSTKLWLFRSYNDPLDRTKKSSKDEFAIFNRELSLYEIQDMYTHGLMGSY